MGVYISNMEMPKSCGSCFVGDRTICSDGCPLVELPPHGRLIDADALKDKPVPINGVWDDERNVFRYYPPTYMQAIDEIVNAPTIIEAEGGET